MIWQDAVLSAGGLVFSIAMIPTIVGKDKPALITSVSTAIVLTAFVFTYATLELWFAMSTTGLTALTWYIVTFQKIRRK